MLLAKVSLLVRLKVPGVKKHAVLVGECGKGKDGINSWGQIMKSATLGNLLTVVVLQVSLYLTNRIPQHSVALRLLVVGVRKELGTSSLHLWRDK